MTATVHAEMAAQRAGEIAYEQLINDGEDGGCTCETCVVREVLTAAYPHMLTIARIELTA